LKKLILKKIKKEIPSSLSLFNFNKLGRSYIIWNLKNNPKIAGYGMVVPAIRFIFSFPGMTDNT
jgi:hypothetical protein